MASAFRKRALIAAALLAFVLKLWLAATTFGTSDAQTFERMLDKLQTRGVTALYLEGTDVNVGKYVFPLQMNHPPFVLTLLRAWGVLRGITGLPLGFWMRLTCAFADLLAFGLVWRMTGIASENWIALLVMALAPVSIMISGFHGNTDPIMIAFVVLAAYLLEERNPAWLAGGAFGLACSIKVWPLLLAPVFLFSAGHARRRIAFCASALGVGAAAAMPWALAAPGLIFTRVFDYPSLQGLWGITYLRPDAANAARTAMFACVLAAAAYMHQRIRPLLAQSALITFLFLFLTPGFGPQYLAWAVPWTVAAGWRSAAAFHVAAGIFVFSLYTAWSLHFPWYFADAHVNPIPHWVLQLGVIPWAATAVLILDVWRRHSISARLFSARASSATADMPAPPAPPR